MRWKLLVLLIIIVAAILLGYFLSTRIDDLGTNATVSPISTTPPEATPTDLPDSKAIPRGTVVEGQVIIQPDTEVAVPTLLPPATPISFITPELLLATRSVTVPMLDGREVPVIIRGEGDVLVIMLPGPNETSEMWADQLNIIANQGFLTLVYNVRSTTDVNEVAIFEQNLVDLKAVIEYGQRLGAEEYVVMGAAEHGMLAIKAAAEAKAKGFVTFSTPTKSGEISLSKEDLQAVTGRKLFIDSENSPIKNEAVTMSEWSENPKTWAFWPGGAQSVAIFDDPENARKSKKFLATFFLQRFVN